MPGLARTSAQLFGHHHHLARGDPFGGTLAGKHGENPSAIACRRRGMLDSMRSPEVIETELMEISAIPDDAVKLERIIVWCTTHPDEVPFALHQLMSRREKHPSASRGSDTTVPLGDLPPKTRDR
jgi:hypothetical protein